MKYTVRFFLVCFAEKNEVPDGQEPLNFFRTFIYEKVYCETCLPRKGDLFPLDFCGNGDCNYEVFDVLHERDRSELDDKRHPVVCVGDTWWIGNEDSLNDREWREFVEAQYINDQLGTDLLEIGFKKPDNLVDGIRYLPREIKSIPPLTNSDVAKIQK